MRFRYTPEMDSFIRDHREGRTFAEAAECFNLRFGTHVTVSAMRSRYKALGIRVDVRKPVGSRLLTDDAVSFMEAHNAGTSASDMADMLNREFGTSCTVSQIRSYRKNHHLPNGRDTRFGKGHVPGNKGMRQTDFIRDPGRMDRVRAGWFRKGGHPHNHVPVGTEVVKSDGYLWRKLAEPDVWRQVHILVWEEANGPLPEGMLVTFLNGDRTDCSPDNLMAVSRDENAHLNKGGLRRMGDRELTKAQALVWRLDRTIGRRMDDEEQSCGSE